MAFQRSTLTQVCTDLEKVQEVEKFKLEDLAHFYYKDNNRKLCNINTQSKDYGFEYHPTKFEVLERKCPDGLEVLYKTRDINDENPDIIYQIELHERNQNHEKRLLLFVDALLCVIIATIIVFATLQVFEWIY